jgi:hypothetical protein
LGFVAQSAADRHSAQANDFGSQNGLRPPQSASVAHPREHHEPGAGQVYVAEHSADDAHVQYPSVQCAPVGLPTQSASTLHWLQNPEVTLHTGVRPEQSAFDAHVRHPSSGGGEPPHAIGYVPVGSAPPGGFTHP